MSGAVATSGTPATRGGAADSTGPAGRARSWFAELQRRSPPLFRLGCAHLLLATALLVWMPFDGGVVLGIDRWMKPFKFAVSIAIFLWTMGWFLEFVASPRLRRVLEWVIFACMTLEIVAITGQAARGTSSHFNAATALDGMIFGTMGAAIAVNTACVALVLLSVLLRPPAGLAPSYLLGLRLGLAVFLVGSAVGGAMVGNGAHAVGVPDGGPGLPVVNWSTEGGDLRIAHGLGLHALQVLPLFGLLAARRGGRGRGPSASGLTLAFATVYLALTLALWIQAAAGRPLLG